MDYESVINKLDGWIDNDGYAGWDIYDGLNSNLTNNLSNNVLKIIITQVNKYSPVNLRKLLQINKGIDLKGLSLFAYAYIMRYNTTRNVNFLKKYRECNSYLFAKSLISQFGFHSWSSHYYPYVTIGESGIADNTPDIVVTSRMLIQLVEGYKITQDPLLKNSAIDVGNFFLQRLMNENKHERYFTYYANKVENRIVYNASSHALEALSALTSIYKSDEVIEIICETVDYLLKNQKNDGSWVYSIDPQSGKSRTQLDFHQGYMLDGLIAAYPYVEEKERLLESIERGAAFYKNIMFRKNGSSYFRYPKPFPIDIHNQAQGIITFSKLGVFKKEYSEFATTILDWTIENMQDPTGYFYYQKWPFITNKIPYMRWSEAWMMLALTTYISLDGRYDT